MASHYLKQPGRARGHTMHDNQTHLDSMSTGFHLDPALLASRRHSSSVCIGDLQLQNQRRLPMAPVRKAAKVKETRRTRLNTIHSQEVFNDVAPRYDFYDDYKPMQYSYVAYESQDRLSRGWRWAKQRKHVLIPWTIGIAVATIMTVLIVTQTVQDFKH
ncbi:unnamed protein product, partial [Mesorhabditis spiculigera]